MSHFNSHRFANKAVLLTCLLAFTVLLAGSVRGYAQAHLNNENILKPILSGRLSDHTAPQVLEGTAIRADHYSPDKKLRLVLSIRPPHMAEEEQYLRELSDKKSPNFHKYLTQDEWNERFAPSAEDEQKVVDWATSAGLTVTRRYNHRLIVDVEATSGVIEKAFDVTINTYKMGENLRFANDRDPVLPNELSGILYNVQGLNNIQHDQSAHPSDAELNAPDYIEGPVVANGGGGHRDGDPVKASAMLAKLHGAQPAAQQDVFANGPVANLTNGDIDPYDVYSSQMYDYSALQALGHCCNPHGDSGGAPNVSNIAIAGFGQFLESDLNTFATDFGLAYSNNYYYIDGTASCNSNGTCDTGETTEDVEYSIAMSNSFGSYLDTSHNYAYLGGNGNNGTYTDIYGDMLSDDTARVMTTSWSCTENYGCSTSTMDSRHAIFANMVGAGWTLIAASGDRGATDDCTHTSVAFPASDYLVVAAGGTQLYLNSDGTWNSESGWQGGFNPYVSSTNTGSCAHNDGGSGGGVSTYYQKQSWQSSYGGSYRLTPDISLNALGQAQIEVEGGSLCCSANGTSVVAPELAGFFAQENAYLNYIGDKCSSSGTTVCTPIGNPLPYVYEEGVSNNAAHNPFYDQTTGCNSNNITQAGDLTYYCAHTSYDLVTGWGSANMLQLAWALNWEVTGADGGPSVSFAGPATNTWYNSNQSVSWTIVDNPGSGFTSANAVGIAGEAQGWDSIKSDSGTEPHGGSGDFFWDGPQYANDHTGCLSFVAGGCSGGVSQGCHTVHVRGWNNQGEGTGDQTYGPLCYDTVAPTISIATSPATSGTVWVDKSVTVTLTSADPGGSGASGIYKTYYAINSASCVPGAVSSCSVYSGPITISTPGQTYIYYFTEDKAGNYSNETYQWVSIDETVPTAKASFSGTVSGTNIYGNIYDTTVGVTLSATAGQSGVANIYYELNGGATTKYSGPFTVSTLGLNSVQYWAVSASGEVETTQLSSFTIYSQTTATLVATPNPSVNGQSVKMTATVKASLAGAGTPTGSVIFYNGATNLGTVALTSGVATLSTTSLPIGALTLQVTYTPTGSFVTTNSAPFDQTVHEITTTTVTSSGNSKPFGSAVTFTATVKPSISGTPTGTVSFYDGSTLLGTGTLSGTSATLATTVLSEGANSITAVYSGDTTYAASTSPAISENIVKAASTIVITTSSHKIGFDQPVTLTAVVTSAGGTPTGSVTFLASGTSLGTASLVDGIGTFVTSSIPLGSYAITASYPGSADFNYSNSGGQSLVVVADTTTTKLTSSINPSNYGAPVTFTATVTPSAAGVPAGTVTFLSNGVSIGTGALSNGVATFATSQLPLGTSAITAAYGGSTDYTASTSSALSEVVKPQTTTTTLASSANPSSFDQSVTFTATVLSSSAVKPTGTVAFLVNGTSVGTATLTGGVGTFATRALPLGTNAVTATYSGSADFTTSTSAVSEVTNQTATTTTVTTSVNPSAFDQAVTIRAFVQSADGVPTGTVTFYANGISIGSAAPAGGIAALTTRVLAVGTNSLTATYSGNADYTASTSTAVSEVTNAAATTAKVISSANPSIVGGSVTFTATISPATAGAVSGTVTFMNGTTALGTKTMTGGIATLATTALPEGADSITVVYSGSADYLASTSSPLTQTVNTAAAVSPVTRNTNR